MDYLRSASTDPFFNMAFDQACLQAPPAGQPFFYLWQNSPAVIIGLNQNAYSEVNLPLLQEKGIALVRRVTGGGAVYHDLQNLNYTIAGRLKDLERDFPDYMNKVADALCKLGVNASLSGRNDIMVDGRKCSGYAKRVWRDRIMIHGTLMFDVNLQDMITALSAPGSKFTAAGVASVRSRVANLKEYLPQFGDIGGFRSAMQEILAAGGVEIPVPASMTELASREADTRFRTWEWNVGRSPAADFTSNGKFSCGTVQASWSLARGVLKSLSFSGDFIGDKPADALSEALRGCRMEACTLLAAMEKSGISPSDCFDGMSSDELLGLLGVR